MTTKTVAVDSGLGTNDPISLRALFFLFFFLLFFFFSFLFFLLGWPLRLCRLKSDRDEISSSIYSRKFHFPISISTHQLTASDFGYDVIFIYVKMTITSFRENGIASQVWRHWLEVCATLGYLIHSTFVYLLDQELMPYRYSSCSSSSSSCWGDALQKASVVSARIRRDDIW